MIDSETQTLLDEHRFLATGRLRLPWQDDPNNYLGQIDWLADLLCSGDADSADIVTNDVHTAFQQLTTNAELGFGGAARDLEDWSGSAADNFAAYLLKAQQAIDRYTEVLRELDAIQAGYATMIREAAKDVKALLNAAVQAQQQGSGNDWQVALTAVAAAVAVAASIIGTAGADVPIIISAAALTGASGAASVASATINSNGPGETAHSLREGMRALLHDVMDQRDRFDKGINQLYDYLTSGDNLPYVQPPAPVIIQPGRPFDPATFGLSDEPSGVQQRVSTDPLIKPAPVIIPDTAIRTRLAGEN